MAKIQKEVFDFSRKTDCAFYWKWLKEGIEKGYVEQENPYTKEMQTIKLKDRVYCFNLWSKNYANFINDHDFLKDYNLFFQFTINGYSKILEPNVPPFEVILKQLEWLAHNYSPKQINPRFDPIIISTMGEIEPTPNKPGLARLRKFEELCKKLNELHIDRVTTSFVSLYGKVLKRMEGIDYITLSEELQIKFLERMVEIADKYNVQIYTCSSPLIENVKGVKKGHCVDGELFESIFGGKISKAKNLGQRESCGCSRSISLADYVNFPCKHRCLYCYSANYNNK